MIIYIKNMVCVRCKMIVQSILESLEIKYTAVELGKAILAAPIDFTLIKHLDILLRKYQLELMEDRKKILVEQVKTSIIELLHSEKNTDHLKLSKYLSKKLLYDYTYLANTFSEVEGSTIERFYIVNRIERVKELMLYEELNLTEIMYRLNYSSVSHLCLQFKKVTGHTPSYFRKLCQSDDFVWRSAD